MGDAYPWDNRAEGTLRATPTEGSVSYLGNPNFSGTVAGPTLAPWVELNLPNSVTYDIVNDPNVAKSGDLYLRFDTNTPGGSIAQDITAQNLRSLSCFGWFRSGGPNPVSGSLTIWNLSINANVSSRFSVGPDWTLVTNTAALNPPGPEDIRIEIYLFTPNASLLVDSINAF
jgi:hypothetical protein